jgi:transmembrane sensor
MAETGKVPLETSQTIEAAARDWAVKLDRGSLSQTEQAALDAWLAGDLRRAGALARAEALMAWTQSARALGPDYAPEDFRLDDDPTRRRLLIWSGTAAATAATAASTAFFVLRPQSQFFETLKGEIRLVPLEEGSTMTLNTETRVKVSFSSHRRHLELLAGEVFLQVAELAARPFEVVAASSVIQATRAAFAVSNLAGMPLSVIVRQGQVELHRAATQLKLGIDMEAIVPRNPANQVLLRTPGDDHVRDAFAWLEGKIVLEGQSLREAAREFYRYSDVRIVVSDPVLAREPVTGLFAANDPIGFCSAITSVLGAKMRIVGQTIVLSR